MTSLYLTDVRFLPYHHPWQQFIWLPQQALVKYLVNNIAGFGMDGDNLLILQQRL